MEEALDEIAEGKLEYLPYLKSFYLGKTGLRTQVKDREKKIDPNESRTIEIASMKGVDVKVGRYGPYIINDGVHASIPEEIAPADLNAETLADIVEQAKRGPKSIGKDSKTGMDIYCLLGRFGPYVQLGELVEGSETKPRRASVPKGVDPKTISLEKALELLSLPRELGVHPTSGKPVLANLGRFGPYVVHEKDYRSLKKDDNVYTVELPRALELLAQEKKSRFGATQLRDMGPHPKDGKPVGIFEGRYGSYLKHGETNATMPKDADVAKITMDEAVKILAEREAQAPKKKSRRR